MFKAVTACAACIARLSQLPSCRHSTRVHLNRRPSCIDHPEHFPISHVIDITLPLRAPRALLSTSTSSISQLPVIHACVLCELAVSRAAVQPTLCSTVRVCRAVVTFGV
eukprot:2795683-Amphidinium_carterae.1